MPRAEDTSFSTKIRKVLGKKPKKEGKKLSTINPATRMEEESEHLFYFLGHLLRAIAPTLSWNSSAFLPHPPFKGHRAIVWELCQQVLKLLKFQELADT